MKNLEKMFPDLKQARRRYETNPRRKLDNRVTFEATVRRSIKAIEGRLYRIVERYGLAGLEEPFYIRAPMQLSVRLEVRRRLRKRGLDIVDGLERDWRGGDVVKSTASCMKIAVRKQYVG